MAAIRHTEATPRQRARRERSNQLVRFMARRSLSDANTADTPQTTNEGASHANRESEQSTEIPSEAQIQINEASIAKLGDHLRGEMAAVETYELSSSTSITSASTTSCSRSTSHARRVDSIRERLRNRGGEAIQSSGVWGVFAKLIPERSGFPGYKVALAALEEGEDRGLALYTEPPRAWRARRAWTAGCERSCRARSSRSSRRLMRSARRSRPTSSRWS